MSLRRTLDALAGHVEGASSMPLSSSCLVNRAELLALIEQARAEFATEIDEASLVLRQRDDLLDGAQREAQELVDAARRQAGELVAVHTLVTGARARADQILDAARIEAARLLREADDYCERRLATLETDLWATLGQVRRGRQRLQDRSGLDRGSRNGAGNGQQGEGDRNAAAEPSDVPEDDGAWSGPPTPRRVVDLAALEREDTTPGRR